MNWLTLFLFFMTDGQPQEDGAEQLDQTSNDHHETTNQDVEELQPDKELLLFLAEWSETQDGQWIDPSAFDEESVLTQQINPQKNKQTGNNHENNPDHH